MALMSGNGLSGVFSHTRDCNLGQGVTLYSGTITKLDSFYRKTNVGLLIKALHFRIMS